MSDDTPPSPTPRGIAGGPPRVVFYDPIPGGWDYDLERSVLDPAGVDLVIPSDPHEAETLIEDADVVVVTSIARLGADQIGRLTGPAGILCYSIGMNQVDHDAAAARGIPVTNVPAYCADEVAEHTIADIVSLLRGISPLDAQVREG